MPDISCRYTTATPRVIRFGEWDVAILTSTGGPLTSSDHHLVTILRNHRHPVSPLRGSRLLVSMSRDDAELLDARLRPWFPGVLADAKGIRTTEEALLELSRTHRTMHRRFRLTTPMPELAINHHPESNSPWVSSRYRRRRELRGLRRQMGHRHAGVVARDLADRYHVEIPKTFLARAFGLGTTPRDIHDIPAFAWCGPWMHHLTLPTPTTDLVAAEVAVREALTASNGLLECETLAVREDGPGRWGRSWTVEFLVDCVLGPERSVTALERAEVRTLVERVWTAVVADLLHSEPAGKYEGPGLHQLDSPR
jgi:hypothetical protein